MALFDGVQNFTPAFTGQQIAIAAGQGAGQSISRGTSAMQRGETMALDKQKFQFQKKEYEANQPTIDDLKSLFDFIKTGMP